MVAILDPAIVNCLVHGMPISVAQLLPVRLNVNNRYLGECGLLK